MIYLNEEDILQIGIDWPEIIGVIETSLNAMRKGEFVQPVKPYLRYKQPENRIIAMPAYVGGSFHQAGIKWIASFPGNLRKGLPRAHSVVVLNDADTGVPEAIIQSSLVSAIRTAGVSGTVLKWFTNSRGLSTAQVGIIGWGPIGRFHYSMCIEMFGDRIERVKVHDIRPDNKEPVLLHPEKIEWVEGWQQAYLSSNVVMTCTVSPERYIDCKPKPGSLLLNVSLRDFTAEAVEGIKAVVVDDWEEVCRENTDIEMLHKEKKGLTASDVFSLQELICGDRETMPSAFLDSSEPVFFNPMGMAVFDIAIASYYLQKARGRGLGLLLK